MNFKKMLTTLLESIIRSAKFNREAFWCPDGLRGKPVKFRYGPAAVAPPLLELTKGELF